MKAFEEEFAAHFGARHAVMVNSGSSANLLALAALTELACVVGEDLALAQDSGVALLAQLP